MILRVIVDLRWVRTVTSTHSRKLMKTRIDVEISTHHGGHRMSYFIFASEKDVRWVITTHTITRIMLIGRFELHHAHRENASSTFDMSDTHLIHTPWIVSIVCSGGSLWCIHRWLPTYFTIVHEWRFDCMTMKIVSQPVLRNSTDGHHASNRITECKCVFGCFN